MQLHSPRACCNGSDPPPLLHLGVEALPQLAVGVQISLKQLQASLATSGFRAWQT